MEAKMVVRRPETVAIELTAQELRTLSEEHQRHADEMHEIARWLLADEDDRKGSLQFQLMAQRRARRAAFLRKAAAKLAEAREVLA